MKLFKKISGFTFLLMMATRVHADSGTTSAAFLNLGAGARADGLAGAYSAAVDDASALFWNPAALAALPSSSVMLMHAPYLDSSYYDSLAYAHSGESSGFAIGGQFFSEGSVAKTDSNGQEAGTAHPNDVALAMAYGHTLGPVSLGLAGKFIRSTLDQTAQTEALDAGILYPLFSNRLRLSLTALNMGSGLKFDQTTSPLPTTYRAGTAIFITPHLLTTVDVSMPSHSDTYASFGLEASIPTSDTTRLSLRGGVTTQKQEGNGLSFGGGLLIKKIQIDYAFVPFGALGDTHRISLTWNFGEHSRS